jgi:hypothetical protein
VYREFRVFEKQEKKIEREALGFGEVEVSSRGRTQAL